MEWVISGILTGISAVAAWATIWRTRRRDRAKMFLSVRENDDDKLVIAATNRGVQPPVLLSYAVAKLDNEGGATALEPPLPGKYVTFEIPADFAKKGVNIELTWTNQDGSRARLQRWYRLTGDHDKDQRSDLVIEGKLLRKLFPPNPFDRKPPSR